MVADFDRCYFFPNLLDDATSFMSCNGGKMCRDLALLHRNVRVAYPRGLQAHSKLFGLQRLQLYRVEQKFSSSGLQKEPLTLGHSD
jgi:hypothetical protein